MRPEPRPRHADIVLIGGGHTHALVLRMWAMRPVPGVRVTLVSDGGEAAYSGMLPGHVNGVYPRERIMIDVRRLCAAAGAVFVQDHVVGLDPDRRQVLTARHPPLAYDFASLNVGGHPKASPIPGASSWAVPVKPVPPFLDAWEAFEARLAAGLLPLPAPVVIVGGGIGGVELAMAMAAKHGTRVAVTVIGREATLAHAHPSRLGRGLAAACRKAGIALRLGESVTAVGEHSVTLASGQLCPSAFTLLVTDAEGPAWLARTGLSLDAKGFVTVDGSLRVTGRAELFAAGDCASLTLSPRPKAGVFAVRAAPVLAHNLRAAVAGRPMRAFRPQKRYLVLVGDGRGGAFAARGEWAAHHRLFWAWKRRIDTRFMDMLAQVPAMPAAPEPAAASDLTIPRCKGCGAKAAPLALREGLAALRGLDPQVAAGDDAALVTVPAGFALVQSVDQITALVDDPYLAARLAVVHAFSDVFAKGARAHGALVALTLPADAPRLQARTLRHAMQGVLDALAPWGAALLGGHTTEGDELSFAVTAQGLVAPDAFLRRDGLREGDVLLLTKALGTGVVFRGLMTGESRASWVDHAVTRMLRDNHAGAVALAAHGARAVTDVTGFGLYGHLLGLLGGPDGAWGARLRAEHLPLLPGAASLARAGVRSSAWEANRAQAPVDFPLPTRERDIVFDPQTSGGLLAGVPALHAADALAALRRAGYDDACAVGVVVKRDALGDSAPIAWES